MHYIYKITNLKTKHYYIGAHSTNNLNDGYMGSGILLKKAIEYYGECSFMKEILEYCKSHSHLYIRERIIVNKKIVLDPNCYNLITGGKRKSKNTFKVKAKTKNCKELLKKYR